MNLLNKLNKKIIITRIPKTFSNLKSYTYLSHVSLCSVRLKLNKMHSRLQSKLPRLNNNTSRIANSPVIYPTLS